MEQENKKKLTDCKGRGRLYFGIAIMVITALFLFKAIHGTSAHKMTGETFHKFGDNHFSETSIDRMLSYSDWIFKEKDLNDRQRENLKTIFQDSTPNFQALKTRHTELKNRFLKALEAEQVNDKELAEIRRAYSELLDQALGQVVNNVLQVAEVLTIDQRKELIEAVREDKHTHKKG